MSLFDIILVQPIFNILLFIYGIIPGHDFGLALILFTILIRVLMWPLVKKQLHQTKVMQKLQPELQKIKQKTKGNKQLEAQMMMELYKERGVNPFGSMGLLIVQLPVLIALFAVVRLVTTDHATNIAHYAYGFIHNLPYITDIIADPSKFNYMMFGMVDLTKQAVSNDGFYFPLFVMAVIAAMLQFVQSKQLLPKVKEKRKLRDMLKDQAAGKTVDQSEISALMSNRMVYVFPALTFVISIYFAGALVLYLLVTSLVAIAQQGYVLREDSEEMIESADKSAQKKLKNAKEAVVTKTEDKTVKKRRKK
ncbi:MAG: YidC/Oxa1 family membrane protein insertase [Candidatus Woesebacteria bacterium]|jgi:YidC/Oxa1 family membrane protein insertase